MLWYGSIFVKTMTVDQKNSALRETTDLRSDGARAGVTRPGTRSVFLTVLSAAFGTWGCSDARPDDKAEATRTYSVDDLTILSAGAESDVYGVRAISVSESGHVWVLNGGPPFVISYTSSARGTSFGVRGEGPGELLNPQALVSAHARVGVWDLGRRHIQWFDESGRVLQPEPMSLPASGRVRGDIRSVTFANPFRLRWTSDGPIVAVYPAGVTRPADMAVGRVVLLDEGTERRLHDFDDGGREEGQRELGPLPLWDVCGGGAPVSIVVLDPNQLVLVRVPLTGGEGSSVPVPVAVEELSRDAAVAYIKDMIALEVPSGTMSPEEIQDQAERMVEDGQEMFSRVAPPATDILCDDIGRTWIQLFDRPELWHNTSSSWLRVDRGGQSARVQLPLGFRPHVIRKELMVGVFTDPIGVEHIARLPLGAQVEMGENESSGELFTRAQDLMTGSTEADLAAAAAVWRRMRRAAAREENPVRQMVALSGLASALKKLGLVEAAREAYEEAEPLGRSTGHRFNQAVLYSSWAKLEEEQGEPARALELIEKAVAAAGSLRDNPQLRARLDQELARLRSTSPDGDESR